MLDEGGEFAGGLVCRFQDLGSRPFAQDFHFLEGQGHRREFRDGTPRDVEELDEFPFMVARGTLGDVVRGRQSCGPQLFRIAVELLIAQLVGDGMAKHRKVAGVLPNLQILKPKMWSLHKLIFQVTRLPPPAYALAISLS